MKNMNRWVRAVVGVIVLLLAGLVYAWTTLKGPIAEACEWASENPTQMATTFTIVMAAFCIGGFISSLAAKKIKVRYILWAAAVLLFLGFFISQLAQSVVVLWIGFGVIAGLGSGFAYNSVMSSISAWFPDKQGLISGILLMGFGIGSFVIGKVYTAVTQPEGNMEWRQSFLILGIIILVVLVIASFFIARPDADWKAPVSTKAKAAVETYEEINTVTMLKRPQFWMYIIWAIFLSAAGLAIIGLGSDIAYEACADLSAGNVATIVGLISIFNGVGRIIFGQLFDKVGYKLTMVIGGIVFLVAMGLILVALNGHSQTVLVISYIVTGLAYGCVTPTNSAFSNKFFGSTHYATNYSIVNMNLLVASFATTIAQNVQSSTNSYIIPIIGVIGLIVIGTVIALFINKRKVQEA